MDHVPATELRGRNITVNEVPPGQVRTDLFLKDKSDALPAHSSAAPITSRIPARPPTRNA